MMSLGKTPLNEIHREMGGKMVEFGGWEMPVQYSGLKEEHQAVRERVGLFDIGHMGQVMITGPDALATVQHVTTNDAAKLSMYQIHYSLFCNEQGGVVDDLLVYRLPEGYLLVVNAGNTEKDMAWLREKCEQFNVSISSLADSHTLLAWQGPLAEHVLAPYCDVDLSSLKYYWAAPGNVFGVPCLLSRTGYTGEDGFEISVPLSRGVGIWQSLLVEMRKVGGLPCGLGARDTLRLEAAMPLYGHEYTEETSPFSVRAGWVVKFGKGDFVGREALMAAQAQPAERQLVGFEMEERAIPRAGYRVFDASGGTMLGTVTSGTLSPTLGKFLGMAFLSPPYEVGRPIQIQIRERLFPAHLVLLPFYSRKKNASLVETYG